MSLPGRDRKDQIWGIYTGHYGLDAKQARPDDANWTGAEIKSCCRLASLLDVPLVQAAQNVVPVAVTAGDTIESLRQWASGRCLSADPAGVYSRSERAGGGRAGEAGAAAAGAKLTAIHPKTCRVDSLRTMTTALPAESEFLLLIADISGYTRFMMTNHTARVHAHGIISDLIAAVIAEIRMPLEVNKLEGDAIFMIAAKQEHDWSRIGEEIGRTLAGFVAAFDRKLTDLATSNICECIACQQMVTLRLKVIGHYGIAIRSRVSGFDELSGVDVIVLHRLLKNGVPGAEYVLLTEPAYRFLSPPGEYLAHRERYDDVGEIALRLRPLVARVPAAAPRSFSLRDAARKIGYDIRYLLARARHPAG